MSRFRFSLFFSIFFIGLMGFGLSASIVTILHPEFQSKIGDVSLLSLVQGKTMLEIERGFEDEFFARDDLIGLWGAVQYGLLKSGGKKVVVGRDGWLFTTEEFERGRSEKIAEQRIANLAGKINKFLQSKGIKLVVVLVPAKARIYSEYLGRIDYPQSKDSVYDRFRQTMIADGIIVPDLASLYMVEKKKNPLYLRLDTHWTPEGARLAAEQVAVVSKDVIFDSSSFREVSGQFVEVEGDLEKYIKTGWFSSIFSPPRDSILRTHVEKTGRVDSEADLFGEESIPVVLVGTSYSAIDKWNFEGALKMALQADVLNLADEGQGPLEPMAKFIKDTDFNTTPAKLVVWEIPERFVTVSYDDVVFPDFIEKREE